MRRARIGLGLTIIEFRVVRGGHCIDGEDSDNVRALETATRTGC